MREGVSALKDRRRGRGISAGSSHIEMNETFPAVVCRGSLESSNRLIPMVNHFKSQDVYD